MQQTAGPLVVTDLDGTVWDRTIQAHPRTLAAIEHLEKNDVPVLAATGGSTFSVRASFARNGLELPAVLLNGSLGYDYRTAETFHEHSFPPDVANQVIEIFLSENLQPAIYTADHKVYSGGEPDTAARHREEIDPALTQTDLTTLADRLAVLVFATLGIDRSRLTSAAQRISALEDVSPAFYEDYLFDAWSIMVQPPGVSKWNGVEAWLGTQDRSFYPIIAIGDGGNDPEMLAAADIGLVIRGGDSRAVDAADFVIPPPEEGGWADVIPMLNIDPLEYP